MLFVSTPILNRTPFHYFQVLTTERFYWQLISNVQTKRQTETARD